MLSLSNKYLLISFLGFAITILCIFKINNVHELRSLNTSLDSEKSKQMVFRQNSKKDRFKATSRSYYEFENKIQRLDRLIELSFQPFTI